MFCTRWTHAVMCVMTILTDKAAVGILSKTLGYAQNLYKQMKALERSQHFSHYKSMEIFQMFNGS